MLLHHALTTSARRVVNEPGWRADGQGGMPQGPRRARGSQPGCGGPPLVVILRHVVVILCLKMWDCEAPSFTGNACACQPTLLTYISSVCYSLAILRTARQFFKIWLPLHQHLTLTIITNNASVRAGLRDLAQKQGHPAGPAWRGRPRQAQSPVPRCPHCRQ